MKLSLKRIYYDRAEVKAALDARAMRAPTQRGGGARPRGQHVKGFRYDVSAPEHQKGNG
jgi:hypothetical protein